MFGNYLFALIIRPLELLFEFIFYNVNKLINNPGLSIIALSLVMNFLVLPLYRQADSLQEEERQNEERLSHWVKHIKKTFKGDERFMMLQTYYRQCDYKPIYALRGSMSLLLEIPFFIAAYHFLSHLSMLEGDSFGPIKNLASPDQLLTIGGITINVLPIVMTTVNIISGMIYANKMSVKSKVQLYTMAVVFLIFLYKSPAGLVFYWTLNNLFSLCKNIFYKLKNPKKVLSVLACMAGLVIMAYAIKTSMLNLYEKAMFIMFGLILCSTVFFAWAKLPEKKVTDEKAGSDKSYRTIFIFSCIFLCILLGFLIPTGVISSSTAEFVEVSVVKNPMRYVVYTMFVSAGFFIVWFGIFYYLASPSGKKIFSVGTLSVAAVFLVNYMFFGTNLGILSATLQFDNQPEYIRKDKLINIAVILGVIAVCALLYKLNKKIAVSIAFAGIMAITVLSIKNTSVINKEYKNIIGLSEQAGDSPTLKLSKKGKNVVVIMMDRMISSFIPYIFAEKPELKETYDGFTYYPNCTSFGRTTNFGAPGLYGGYEYTPKEMNKRDTELLADKTNEALKVMPVIFDNENYGVTVFDPTYAGYSWIPDISIYDDYPNIRKFIALGKFNSNDAEIKDSENLLYRNFFYYSVFKTVPLFLQTDIYDAGNYCSTSKYEEKVDYIMDGQRCDNLSSAWGYNPMFMESYYELDNLANITEIDDSQSQFFMMSNNLTHSPTMVKEPEYLPDYNVDNTEYDNEHGYKRYNENGDELELPDENLFFHYHSNMSAVVMMGKWFDYLKSIGVYDNTKIIIVSDHGWPLGNNPDMAENVTINNAEGEHEEYMDYTGHNCTLMVKDFGATGFNVDNTFMTNADVPTIAFEGTVQNPVNPFTGKAIDSSYKKNNPIEVIWSREWDTTTNNGKKFLPDDWFSVHDDIHNKDNWKYLGYY